LRGETCGTGILPVTGSDPVPHLYLIEKCYISMYQFIYCEYLLPRSEEDLMASNCLLTLWYLIREKGLK